MTQLDLFWNTGQGQYCKEWYLGISIPLEIKNWATLGAEWCTFIFWNVNYFIINFSWNQKRLFSEVWLFAIVCWMAFCSTFVSFWLWSSVASSFEGIGVSPDAQRAQQELRLFLSCSVPLVWEQQYVKWHLNNLMESVHKSRATEQSLQPLGGESLAVFWGIPYQLS